MVRFASTSNQIEQLGANIQNRFGRHARLQPTVSVGGIDVGSLDYNPRRHKPSQIDPFSLMAQITGEAQVRVQIPMNPLLISFVGDYRFHGDRPEVARMKTKAIDTILRSLEDTVPNLDPQDTRKLRGGPETDARTEEELLRFCSDGLCVIVGDFRRFKLDKAFSNRANVIALKVNHGIERSVMSNVGQVSLGRGVSVNTNKPEALQRVNDSLAEQHDTIMARLEAAGAIAGSVILAPRAEGHLLMPDTDLVMAGAIQSIS